VSTVISVYFLVGRLRLILKNSFNHHIYYKDNCIVLIYVDDCIILSKNKSVIDDFILSLKNGKEKYVLTDEGEIDKYLGVDIVKTKTSVTMTQPYLIERCLEEMEITKDMNIKKVPASKPLLHKDKEGAPRQHTWRYRTVIGMLNYLKCSTRPDLGMAVHQCARF